MKYKTIMIDEAVRRVEMQERIENYILGGLTREDIDGLLIEFLKAPEL